MKKIYLILICLGVFAVHENSGMCAQNSSYGDKENSQAIKGLVIAPNPTFGDILYITSEGNHSKVVSIYNVLGEQVMLKVLIGKELNVSKLSPGIYILKIKEGDFTSTIKLIKNT